MAAVLEARAVITAEDKTGKAFDSLKARIAGITRQVETLDRATGSVGSVAKGVDAISVATGRATGDMERFISTTRSMSTASAAIGTVERSAGAMTATISRSSAAVAKLGSELFEAGGKLKAIETFRTSSRAIDEASLAMRKAQQDVRRLGAEVAAAENPTKSLQAALDRAKAEVIQTGDAFKQQGVAAREARAALEAFGVPLNRVRTEEERLKGVVESTTTAIRQQVTVEREATAATEVHARAQVQAAQAAEKVAREQQRFAEQRAHGMAHEGFTRFALTNAAMAVGAGEVVHLGSEAWHQGAELNHERIGLANAGRTPREIQEIEAAARNVVSTLPTASFTESMKVVAETTQAFGSVEHAVNNLPFMMKTMSVLKAAGGEHIHGSAGDVGRALAKTFEERQTRPEDFEKEASAMIPAMVASGGTFNPEQLYAFAQQAKSALPSLSMRFLSKIAPSLIGAQGGERAGTALNAFENTISGKAHDAKQVEAFMKLGLLDPSMVMGKAGHQTSWKSGAVKDTFLAMTDPLAWSEKYLIPALQKHGVDTNNREAVKQILDTMFRNQNANVFASEITQAASRARLHKDEALYNEVGDENGIYQRNLADFGVAAGALKDAIGNLAAATTAPMMRGSAGMLSGLASILNSAAKYGFEHPTIAAGAGVAAGAGALYGAGRLSYSILNGFGLKGSAVALDAAAAHLMEVGGGPGGPWKNLPKGGIVPAGGSPGALAIPAAVELGSGVVALGGAAVLTEAIKQSFGAQQPGHGGLYAPPTAASESTDRLNLADWRAERDDLARKVANQKALEKLPGSSDVSTYNDRRRIEQLDGAITQLKGRLDNLYISHDREVERGRAYMSMQQSDVASGSEPFGPPAPPMPANFSRRTLGYWIKSTRPSAEAGEMPMATPPHGGPVPVAIVSAPSAIRDGWLDGDRPGIEERSRRGAAMFRRDPEGTRGQHMLDHDAEISPHVDTSGIDAVSAKVQEASEHMAALGAMSVEPHVGTAQLDAIIAKAERAKALLASLGGGAGGTSGSVGTSYPQTAPTGRQMGPR